MSFGAGLPIFALPVRDRGDRVPTGSNPLSDGQKRHDTAPVGAKHLGDYLFISTNILLPNASPFLTQRDTIRPLRNRVSSLNINIVINLCEKPGFWSPKKTRSRYGILRNRVSSVNLDIVINLCEKPGFLRPKKDAIAPSRNRVSSLNPDIVINLREKPGFWSRSRLNRQKNAPNIVN